MSLGSVADRGASPRGRGSPEALDTATFAGGCIPAWAGEPDTISLASSLRLGRNRRLAKDYENLASTLAAFVAVASIRLALKRLTRPS